MLCHWSETIVPQEWDYCATEVGISCHVSEKTYFVRIFSYFTGIFTYSTRIFPYFARIFSYSTRIFPYFTDSILNGASISLIITAMTNEKAAREDSRLNVSLVMIWGIWRLIYSSFAQPTTDGFVVGIEENRSEDDATEESSDSHGPNI